tara:strand:+ start:2236 stop:2385 length:150 start_codon:yes stop_codon:yes gene_type:complete
VIYADDIVKDAGIGVIVEVEEGRFKKVYRFKKQDTERFLDSEICKLPEN